MHHLARFAVITLVAASFVFGGIALAGGNSGSTKPGKGCGDKNHVHYNEVECPKPPK